MLAFGVKTVSSLVATGSGTSNFSSYSTTGTLRKSVGEKGLYPHQRLWYRKRKRMDADESPTKFTC